MQNVNEVIKPDIIAMGGRLFNFYDRLYTNCEDSTSYGEVPVMLIN
jgi:hypothetical protein